jgi:hypothetical protein
MARATLHANFFYLGSATAGLAHLGATVLRASSVKETIFCPQPTFIFIFVDFEIAFKQLNVHAQISY